MPKTLATPVRRPIAASWPERLEAERPLRSAADRRGDVARERPGPGGARAAPSADGSRRSPDRARARSRRAPTRRASPAPRGARRPRRGRRGFGTGARRRAGSGRCRPSRRACSPGCVRPSRQLDDAVADAAHLRAGDDLDAARGELPLRVARRASGPARAGSASSGVTRTMRRWSSRRLRVEAQRLAHEVVDARRCVSTPANPPPATTKVISGWRAPAAHSELASSSCVISRLRSAIASPSDLIVSAQLLDAGQAEEVRARAERQDQVVVRQVVACGRRAVRRPARSRRLEVDRLDRADEGVDPSGAASGAG